VWDSNWAESFQPIDIVEVESARAIRKVLAGRQGFVPAGAKREARGSAVPEAWPTSQNERNEVEQLAGCSGRFPQLAQQAA
jgi:hypothetical protein